MKVLSSNKESVWIEADSTSKKGTLSLFFTQEKKMTKKESNDLKKEKKAANKDQSLAQQIYEEYKPAVDEKNVYEFINISILLNGLRFKGILNYRLNGQQEQLRLEGFVNHGKNTVIKRI